MSVVLPGILLAVSLVVAVSSVHAVSVVSSVPGASVGQMVPSGDRSPGPRLSGLLIHDGVPADSGTVVLHRVDADHAGPVDSVRADPQGRFRFALPEGEFWFVSTHRDGVVYSSGPLSPSIPGGVDDRDLEVDPGRSAPEALVELRLETFPARSVPPGGIMLPVEGREVTLGPRQADGRWPVVDRFRLRNDSTATWVAGDAGPVVWQFPLPSGAGAIRYVEGDPATDAVFFQGTGVQVVGPLRPGATVLTLAYELPSLEFRLPLPGVTEALAVRTARGLPLLSVEGLDGPFQEDARAGQGFPGGGTSQADAGPSGAVHGGFTIWSGAHLRNRILHVAPTAGTGSPPWVATLLGLVLVGMGTLVFVRRRVNEASSE